ncbi:hypothetical protein CGLO_09290 [Colletotrichum gloeosporioides Cg-14]|uniref:Uncharacterized protein n=1 Tax=Colletotrichum gloeosporioides (strain Cg-14) TaxID=1237896 RepID=T0KGF3_COLGC|nr:hypothetical protein CGLO_09290 [Colletotrichum gloeosporioides Cg-14]
MDTTGLSVASSMERISQITEETSPVRPLTSAAGKQLFWTANGPLETAIQVAASQYYKSGEAVELYFRPAVAGLEPTWYPWEEAWVELHRDCTDTKIDTRRPRAKYVQLEVKAGGDFVTIHDYVSAVHPWIMATQETLLNVFYKVGGGQLFPPEMTLVVLRFGDGPLSIGREDQ